MEKLNNLIVNVCGKEYEFSGGGSITPGVPIPEDTVNSNSVLDGSLQRNDMDDDVKTGLDELNNINLTDEDLEGIFKDNEGE